MSITIEKGCQSLCANVNSDKFRGNMKGIVGKELLSKFEMLFEIPENESFNKLYDMWKFFHNNNDAPDINTPKDSGQTGTTNLINSDGEGNQILTHQSANSELFDIANLEVVYEDSPMIINNMTDPSVCGIEMNLEKDVRPTSAIDNISEPVADDLLTNSASDVKEQEVETTPVKDSAKSVQTDVKIDNVLYWPVTPERKGKQNTERVPFVITAAKWQDIQCKKIEVAQDKERLKEERKRKRIENQQIRENKKKESETTKKRVIKRHCKKANVKDEAKAEAVGITRSKGIQILSDVTILPPVRTNNKEVELNKRNSNLNIKENTNAEVPLPNVQDLFKHNIVQNLKGLCHICANTILGNCGLKCISCRRKYHFVCLVNHNIIDLSNIPCVFKCKTCSNNC